MRAPNCATGPHVPATAWANLILSRQRTVNVRRQMPPALTSSASLEKRPHPRPRIALLRRVLRLPRRPVHAAIEQCDRPAGSRRPWSPPAAACAPAAHPPAACSLRCSHPRRWSRHVHQQRNPQPIDAVTAATAPCRRRACRHGAPPNRFCGSISCRCRSTPFHARRWNRLVTGTIATAALNVAGFRKIRQQRDQPAVAPADDADRAGSTADTWLFNTSTAVTTSSTSAPP